MAMLGLRVFQTAVFASVWVLYAATYLVRKPIGVMKVGLGEDLSLSKTQLGWLDTAILLPYALVQMSCGRLADVVGPRHTVAACLFVAGLSVLTFGWWDNYTTLLALLALSGAAQAPVWPACCKCLAAWFPDNALNSVFGVVSTSVYFGSIVATAFASYLHYRYGWRFVFFPLAVLVMGLGLVSWLVLKMPKEYQLVVPGKSTPSNVVRSKLSTWQLWQISMVPQLSVAMMALKLVRYSVYLWLPVYLMQGLNLSATAAGVLLVLFDVGGILGSVALGFMADRHASLFHTWLAVVFSSFAFLVFLFTAAWGPGYNGTSLFIAGACVCGPDALLGGSVAVAIGEQNGHNSGAAVAGLINGFGSLGGVLEGPLVGYVSEVYGWNNMFLLIIVLLLLSSFCVLQALIVQRRQANLWQQLPFQNGV